MGVGRPATAAARPYRARCHTTPQREPTGTPSIAAGAERRERDRQSLHNAAWPRPPLARVSPTVPPNDEDEAAQPQAQDKAKVDFLERERESALRDWYLQFKKKKKIGNINKEIYTIETALRPSIALLRTRAGAPGAPPRAPGRARAPRRKPKRSLSINRACDDVWDQIVTF